MKVIVAIDSLKGSLSSLEAGKAVEDGIKKAIPTAEVMIKPVADGGEGTVTALTTGLQGSLEKVAVTGPLGQKVEAAYGILPDKTAVIEMAEAAGLLKHVRELHADGDDHVLGLRDGGAVDRDALFDQRHAGIAVAGDVGERGAVEHDRAHVQRELALGDDLADGIVDQHLFAALRVEGLERADLHAVLVLRELPVQLNAAGLVVLNAEDHTAYL